MSLDNRIKKINYVVRGWGNYVRIEDMRNMIIKIDKHLRTRIRVIIWKQWKKITKKYKALRQLGVSHEIAFASRISGKLPEDFSYGYAKSICQEICIKL